MSRYAKYASWLAELKKRIEIIESKQRVDNLTKTLDGDE